MQPDRIMQCAVQMGLTKRNLQEVVGRRRSLCRLVVDPVVDAPQHFLRRLVEGDDADRLEPGSGLFKEGGPGVERQHAGEVEALSCAARELGRVF